MVWGLVNPSSFGDFFPNGDYVGWKEGIKEYYDNDMSDAEKAEMGMKERILYSKFSSKFTEDKGLLEPHECPTEYKLSETPKSLGSLIKLESRLLAVDDALKGIIETLEPGVHQFWPLRIILRTGKEYPVPYYGMVIRQFLDSFVPEQSDDFRTSSGGGLYFAIIPTQKGYGKLTVLKSVINGAHLWRERRLSNPEILFSDDLQAEIARRGLRLPKHHKLKVV